MNKLSVIVDSEQSDFVELEGRSEYFNKLKQSTNTIQVDVDILKVKLIECITPVIESLEELETNHNGTYHVSEFEVNMAFDTKGNISILSALEATRSNQVALKAKIEHREKK